MSHWINSYIGKPWEIAGVGPSSFDCIGLVQEVLKTRYNVILPTIQVDYSNLLSVVRAIKHHNGWLTWELAFYPKDGYLVKLYRQDQPDHIGIYVDVEGGGILHSQRDVGVCFDKPFILKTVGWKKLEYFRYRGING